jgi:coenzyme F420-reducing hydrogenase delta subunit
MAPPSLIDFILSRNLADGVVVAGCAESACFNRLGMDWTMERFAGTRDPYLRARVPRERLLTIWTSALAERHAATEIAAFTEKIASMPPPKLQSPLPPTAPARASAQTPVREKVDAPK